jgi:hypothetical protein
MNLIGGKIFYYKDAHYIEIDAIIQFKNTFVACEIKLGSIYGINDGIKQINKFRSILSEEEKKKYSSFCIITASNLLIAINKMISILSPSTKFFGYLNILFRLVYFLNKYNHLYDIKNKKSSLSLSLSLSNKC